MASCAPTNWQVSCRSRMSKVGRAAVDGWNPLYGNRTSLFQIGCGDVQRRNAWTPGRLLATTVGELVELRADGVTSRLIRRQTIIIVRRVKMAAEFELLQIVQTGHALSLPFWHFVSAGSNIAARMPMMAMTTRSSMSVNASGREVRGENRDMEDSEALFHLLPPFAPRSSTRARMMALRLKYAALGGLRLEF